MYTKILTEIEFKKELLAGMKIGVDRVKRTMGPRGKNVMFLRKNESPELSNDGKHILDKITIKNEFQAGGLSIAQDVAKAVAKKAGDSTSASVTLLYDISEKAIKDMPSLLYPDEYAKGMRQASKDITEILSAQVKQIEGYSDIKAVALTSSESEEISAAVADIFQEVGKDGIVTYEESSTPGIRKEIVKGMVIDSGLVSQYLITNEKKNEASLQNVPVMVYPDNFYKELPLALLAKNLADNGIPQIVIVCKDIDGQALEFVNLNKTQGGFFILPVKISDDDIFRDIAKATGAKVLPPSFDFSEAIKTEAGSNSVIASFGYVKKIICSATATQFIGGKADKNLLKDHIETLKNSRDFHEDEYEKSILDKRIARLSSGVAILRIGTFSGLSMSYLLDKVEDTIANVRGALEEGVVVGGGFALIHASTVIIPEEKYLRDFLKGYLCVQDTIHTPAMNIMLNAGCTDWQLILNKVVAGSGKEGYNALIDDIVPDMFKAGIIDSKKSVCAALEYAVEAAASIVTADSGFVDIEEEEN